MSLPATVPGAPTQLRPVGWLNDFDTFTGHKVRDVRGGLKALHFQGRHADLRHESTGWKWSK